MNRDEFPLPTIARKYNDGGWLQTHLSYLPKTKDVIVSPFGVVVAEILGYLWGGLHNLRPMNWERWGLQFSDPHCIEVVVPSSGGWGTFDNSRLTHLVVIAAMTGIRVEINPVNRNYFRLYFHRRFTQHLPLPDSTEGVFKYAYTHPTLESMAAEVSKYFKVEWEQATEAQT